MEATEFLEVARDPTPPIAPGAAPVRLTIEASDGYPLAAHRFMPEPPRSPRALVVVPAAMGVRQDYYFPFAQYLASLGFAVLTFDYRGMGASAPKTLRGFRATLNDWAQLDYDAALRHGRQVLDTFDGPRRQLFVVGHSLGGQLPGLVPSRHLVDGLVTVASGSGYWRENAPQLKRFVWFLWYFAVPVYTALAGYFPGRRVRKVGDLPKGVIQQWSRWCRDPEYMIGAEGEAARAAYANFASPMLCVSFTDDELMSSRNCESLQDFYRAADKTVRRIAPADVGLRRIGHFGFFRPSGASLWPTVGQWLLHR